MSYKKIYKKEILANTLKAKQKRQYAAYLFARLIAEGKQVINIDESTLDQTYYIRKGWGVKGQKLFTVKGTRLNKFNIIAAASNHGAVWFQTNNGKNNSITFWNFILNLILNLQEENPLWRRHTVFLLDNAQFHKSDWIIDKFVEFQIPVLFSGPYSYDASPIEKIFA